MLNISPRSASSSPGLQTESPVLSTHGSTLFVDFETWAWQHLPAAFPRAVQSLIRPLEADRGDRVDEERRRCRPRR